MSTIPRHLITHLALLQPTQCLVTDEDLLTLAQAEAMFRGHWQREQRAAAGNDNDRAATADQVA